MNINSTSSTNNNRITGLATGLDVDSLVKSSLQPFQTRVNKQTQQKEILEIKQKLYRDLMSEGKKIYDKYFDIAKSDNLVSSSNYSAASFDSNNSGVVTAKGVAGGKVDNYRVKVEQIARGANTTISFDALKAADANTNQLTFAKGSDIIKVDISGATDNASLAKIINNAVGGLNMKATYSEFSKGITIETKTAGKDQSFTMDIGKLSGGVYTPISSNTFNGTNLRATITNSKNQSITYDDATNVSKTNTVTIDGVQFSFFTESKVIGTDPLDPTIDIYEETKITGKADVSALKDKITNFINDYNTFIEKMNKLLNDKRDRSYQPLTADQKKEMSESEVKLWNEKVEAGQLRRDDDITRISNSLRNSTKDPVEGSNLYLEKIGISPSKDYGGNKIGTLLISDPTKLTEALQNDPEGVMNLLIASPENKTSLTKDEIYSKSGILKRMGDILNSELLLSSSTLSKKAGLADGSTVVYNELSKSISKYTTKIKEMQTDLARREQGFYTKYSKLETIMNKYNSQQAYLSSQFSGGQ